MKLRTKMSLAFGTVFIACAAAALMVTLTLERSAGKIVEIAKGVQPVSVNLLQIRDSHQKLHALVLRSLASPHDPDIPRQQRTISDRLNMVRGGLDKLFDALGNVQQRVPYVEPVLLEKLHRHSAETMRLADAVIATAPEDLPRAQDLFRGPYQESHAALALARNALKAQVDLLQKRQLSGLADAFRDNIRTVAFVFVLVLLAIFVITIASNRSIVSRVRCLREATERFAEGHLSARASLKARDEFGDLAAAFNRMADTVQGQTAALRSHAKLLQKRVEERTEQLRAKAQELQQKNRQLGNANRQLSRLDGMKNDLIATASHELRTPLTAMHGSLELLLKGQFSELSGDAIQLIHLCRRNVKRLIDLVGELLDLSLIDHGKLRLKPERVDLRRLAQEV
ncbi:MAG: histidine kinase dimerization/phospho-acceptor domain-containing protein, partial [Planctomycetia bacterium]|nr:histidine kinase dimerization/phospho-acceptor domain-containing protein [Planctomycetia bacterium]